jgi:ligand-binding sensor domain-containing protein/AraC-like DNA-binding protein
LCLFISIFISSPLNVSASGFEKDRLPYIFKTWTTQEGLPQHSVLSLLQDKTGYIWFGTRSGLARFDGVEFRIYNRWNTPQLKSDSFTALYQDAHGVLWVGTGGGLSCLKSGLTGGRWATYTTKDGLSDNNVTAICGSGDILWIGTANGLNRFKDGLFQVYTAEDDLWGNSITAILPRSGGGLWVGTGDNGLYMLKDGTYKPVSAEGAPARFEVTALCKKNNTGDGGGDNLWLGTENGLYYLKDGKILDPVPEDHPLSGNAVRSLEMTGGGSLLVGTDGEGLYRHQNGGFQLIPLPPAIAGDFIYALREDRESNLWLGTYTGGLVRLTPARVETVFTTVDDADPRRNRDLVHTLMEDKNGALLVGTDGKGLVKINTVDPDGRRMPRPPRRVKGVQGARVTALYEDRESNLWVGTIGGGLTRLKNGTSRVFTTNEGLSSNRVTTVCEDDGGTLWVGTVRGLNRFEKERFILLPGPTLRIRTIAPYRRDPRFRLWVGTDSGLKRLTRNGGRLEDFSTPGGESFAHDILTFYVAGNDDNDDKGSLWVGANGGGLARINVKTGEMTRYTTDNGLPDNYIFSILEDDRGNLWMGSYKGVFQVSGSQLDDLGRGRISALTPLCFDERDGMMSSECVPGGQPSAWKTADGKLGFPTLKGIAFFDPSTIKINRLPPPVVIQEIYADNEPVNTAEKKVFSRRKRVVEFYFTALSFTVPEKVKLRYKLEGFDTRWMDVAPRQKRAALYLNLGPGDYAFKVSACNNDGLWNDTGAVYAFTIARPFFQKPFFYLFLVLGLAAGAAVLRFVYRKKRAIVTEPVKEEPKYKTSALLPETVDEVLPRLRQMMEKEKVYLDADLTLKKLAKPLNVHYNYLSQIINERMGKSFNDFINQYRIREAKAKLADPAERKKTILEIAYETGFYSKSVFNTAFKKFTGMTPSEFRRGCELK